MRDNYIAQLEEQNKHLLEMLAKPYTLNANPTIVIPTEQINRQALMIYAKDRQIAELTRMLFALGKQDGQTIRAQAAEIKRLRGVIISYQAGQQ